MKKAIFLLLVILAGLQSFNQIPWSRDSIMPGKDDWNSYSTSFVGSIHDSIPFIVTAIPSMTVEDMNMPLDLDFDGSLFRFKSSLTEMTRRIYTTDSANVYFLTPGIYPANADRFEYRVTLNAKSLIKPWSKVDEFSDLQLNNFKKGFGFLGGFKTTWGNFITVELRRKNTDSVLSSAIIFWKETKPQIKSIYSTRNLNDFFKFLSRPWDKSIKPQVIPKRLLLNPDENALIFSIAEEIYKKQELEYALFKDGEAVIDWHANEFDNNFIWLQGLSHGHYTLKIRFAKQRHNSTEYNFEIRPAWHQTAAFKIIAILLVLICLSSILLFRRLVKQKKRLLKEQQQNEKREIELGALRSQLNPHFIFNALGSIQGLINNNEIQNANKYLADFASLMRSTLSANSKNYNSLSEEIKALEIYLQLEQMRFHFRYSISVDKTIDLSAVEMPSLLVQPLLENAVKHGVSGLQEKGNIELRVERLDKDLRITVSDNGPGFVISEKRDGRGLDLTRSRIAVLNQGLKTNVVNFEIRPGAGTTIFITFKNWLG